MNEPIATEETRKELMFLIRGFQVSRLLRLVADLGLADRVPTDGKRSVESIAAECSVLPGQLVRVVRALAAAGVFQIDADGMISHSPHSLLLRSGTHNGLHEAARFYTAPGSWKAWGELDAALGGQVPHEVAWGIGRFDYLREHPGEARLFDAYMARVPDRRHDAIAASYDFSGARLIVDIGGGNGETLRRILARYPQAEGIVFDRPDVVGAISEDSLAGGRIRTEGGSFFERVPAGADIYMLVRVLHDWSDEDCMRILRVSRATMPASARLLVGEQLLNPDPQHGSPADYLIDMQMMAMFGAARERTEADLSQLLAASGFTVNRVIATGATGSIIEASPA